MSDRKINVVALDDFRPHDAQYVVCMDCAHDWIAVSPTTVTEFECPGCGAMSGEVVQPHNLEWFKRFMAGKNTNRRTLVLLNAKRMETE